MGKRKGLSYPKKVAEINKIYDEHVSDGLSNREIWIRYVYPVYCISERTFYNILNALPRIVRYDNQESTGNDEFR